MKHLRQEVVLALLWVECAKEPELVFLNRSAHVDAAIDLRKALGRRPGERKLICITNQPLRGKVTESVAVDFVAATLGDDVENTAGRSAILGAVRAGLDFNFLHE